MTVQLIAAQSWPLTRNKEIIDMCLFSEGYSPEQRWTELGDWRGQWCGGGLAGL